MKILVTGAAGFIGSFVCKRLLAAGNEVLGIDNLNAYYDVSLKEARLQQLTALPQFTFKKLDIADRVAVEDLFKNSPVQKVLHLAAQAGVRYSVTNPHAYIESNLMGFLNILEGCRHHKIEHLVYASTSSVYGLSKKIPFSEHDDADHPVSLYGATKRANELMAHSYSHLYSLPTTGLRFFTVYGPWGRPDMALFLFTKNILEGRPIQIFNQGHHVRDFTYVEDIAEGIFRILQAPASKSSPKWDPLKPDPSESSAPFRLYNIGNNRAEELLRYIEVLEDCLKKKAERIHLPMQLGDVEATRADVSGLAADFDYKPSTSIEVGISRFVEWYLDYYKVR